MHPVPRHPVLLIFTLLMFAVEQKIFHERIAYPADMCLGVETLEEPASASARGSDVAELRHESADDLHPD